MKIQTLKKMADVENTNEQICRICLTRSQNMKSIFHIFIADTYVVLMSDFIEKITSVKMVKHDGLPQHLCTACVTSACQIYKFTKLCISSDSYLRQQAVTNNSDATKNLKSETEGNDLIIKTEELGDLVLANDVEIVMEDETTTDIPIQESTNSFIDSTVLQNANKAETNDLENAGITKDENDTVSKFRSEKQRPKLNQKTSGSGFHNTYKCHDCSRIFPMKRHLSVHMRTHIPIENKQHVCDICHKQFLYAYLLKQHKYKHTNERPFPCTKCNKGCLTAESLRRHMKIHEETGEKKTHICTVCSKEFQFRSFLAEHMKNHTGEKPYLCSFCGKGFRQNGALEYHIRTHTGYKPYTCPVCQNKFSSQSILRVHMRRYTNERPYVCDVCGTAFRQLTDLKSHHRTHTGTKRILCTVCGKYMSTTGQLTVHLRSHTGEKPFACSFCSKAFTTRNVLVKHTRIHTGERPYVCKLCGRAFSQSSSLKKHQLVHKKQNLDMDEVEQTKNPKNDIFNASS